MIRRTQAHDPVPTRAGRPTLEPMFAAATKTKTRPRTASKTKTELAPPWNVIVHDDPISLMSYVTVILKRVFGYSQAKAHKLMMEVHETGRSVVWTGEREKAELYLTKLHGAQLLATIERVSE